MAPSLARQPCLMDLCISDGMYVYKGTRRMVTARELVVVLSGSSRPTPSQSDGSVTDVVMRATRDTQSPMLKAEKLISTKWPWWLATLNARVSALS